jgi:uncharacterized protein (DUF608 family)
MKTVTVKTTCEAEVAETWEFKIDDEWEPTGDADEDFEYLTNNADLIDVEDEVSNEREREVSSLEVVTAL